MKKLTNYINIDKNIPTIFLVFAVMVGLTFLIITPPFKAPDESAHFYRAYSVATFNITSQKQGEEYGTNIPKSIQQMTKDLESSENPQSNMSQYKHSIKYWGTRPLNDTVGSFKVFNNSSIYSPVPYIPQAIGINIGRLLHLSPLLVFYSGRLVNLFVWILLIYFSIKFIPFGKWVIFCIALIPISIFQVSSMSADAATYGLIVFFISLFMYLRSNPVRISQSTKVLFLTLPLLLSLLKFGYFTFAFFLIFIPDRYFESKRDKWIKVCLITVISTVLTLIWYFVVKDINILYSSPAQDLLVDPVRQRGYIFTYPLQFVKTILFTLFIHPVSNNILTSSIGELGWLNIKIPLFLIVGNFVTIFLSLISIKPLKSFKLSKPLVLYTAGLIVFLILFLCIALYITYSPVGSVDIAGIQGRYFIPIFALFIILFSYKRTKFSLQAVVPSSIYPAFYIFSLSIAIYFTFTFYY